MRCLQALFLFLFISMSGLGSGLVWAQQNGQAGPSGERRFVPLDEYRRQNNDRYIPLDEYRRSQDGRYIPLDEYRRSQDGRYTPLDEYRRSNDDRYIPLPTAPDGWGDFWDRVQGSREIWWGSRLVYWGTSSTVILFADNGTVIGVVDDPLVLVTGGTAVVGGVIVIGHGIYFWAETMGQ